MDLPTYKMILARAAATATEQEKVNGVTSDFIRAEAKACGYHGEISQRHIIQLMDDIQREVRRRLAPESPATGDVR